MREKFIEALKDRTGKEVMTKEMEKGFGISVVGEPGIPIPVFYWETLEPIAKEKGIDHVVDMYIDCMDKAKNDFIMPEITADYIKQNVHRCIRALTDNEDILKSVLFGTYEIYYAVIVKEDAQQRSVVKLTNKIIESVGMTPGEVADAANKNDLESFECFNLGDMFGVKDSPMLVATNKQKINGAGVIFTEEVAEKITEKIGDFVILPSSIHEVIVIPIKNASTQMVEMVKSINEEVVDEKDVLGNTLLKCVNGIFDVFEWLEVIICYTI